MTLCGIFKRTHGGLEGIVSGWSESLSFEFSDEMRLVVELDNELRLDEKKGRSIVKRLVWTVLKRK